MARVMVDMGGLGVLDFRFGLQVGVGLVEGASGVAGVDVGVEPHLVQDSAYVASAVVWAVVFAGGAGGGVHVIGNRHRDFARCQLPYPAWCRAVCQGR